MEDSMIWNKSLVHIEICNLHIDLRSSFALTIVCIGLSTHNHNAYF